jgi:type VI secretion system secreted protein Hcp
MEYKGFMNVIGSNQGRISSGDTIIERVGAIGVLSLKHAVDQPIGTMSAMSNSVARHTPIIIQKEFGKDSPAFFQAMDKKEKLTSVEIEWYKFDYTGDESLFYKVKLEDAYLIKIESNNPTPWLGDTDNLKFIETYSFIYRKIDWAWGPDGASAYKSSWARADNA